MADPTPYARSYGFRNWQSQHPTQPLPGDEVDAELDNVSTSLNETIDNLALIQRSDGALQNGVVTADSLSPAVLTALDLNDSLALAEAAAAAAASATAAAGSATTATTQAGVANAAAGALTGNTNNRRMVRVAATGNVTVSNPGTAVFDGVTLSAGDRVLLASQSTASQNGVYDFNGSSSAMTRSVDSDTSVEMPPQLVVAVSEGSASAGANYTLTTVAPITLGSTSLTFRKDQSVSTSATPQFAGVTFGGSTLSAYAKSSWTPVDGFSAFVWSALGYYVRVGDVVHVWAIVNTGAQASATAMQIAGLPVSAGDTGGIDMQVLSGWVNGSAVPWILNRSTGVMKPLKGGAFSEFQNVQIFVSGSYTVQA